MPRGRRGFADGHWGGEDYMATDTVESGSPEAVAFRLFEIIAASEGKALSHSMAGNANAERKWVLDTYAECLRAVTNPVSRISRTNE